MKRKWYRGSGYTYFVTNTIEGWKRIFISEPYMNLVLKSLDFFRNKGIDLIAYVIMPTHLHYIVYPRTEDLSLSDMQRDFKKYLSRRITKLLTLEAAKGEFEVIEEFRNAGLHRKETPIELLEYFGKLGKLEGHDSKVWRCDDYPEAIYSYWFFAQKLRYIHDNPCRAGIVELATDYRYSSARNYEFQDNSLIEIDLDTAILHGR